MSASEMFSVRKQLAEELRSNDYRAEDASYISRQLSAEALCLIAELGLEVAA